MKLMEIISHTIEHILGFDKRSQAVHDQKNRYTAQMLEIQRKNKQMERMAAYKIAVVTGRISNARS